MDHDPKKLRAWGRLLSTLLQTPDDELDDFARERLAGAKLDEGALRKARELLTHLGEALDEPEADRWRGIEHAADTIAHWEEGRRGSTPPPDGSASTPPAASSPESSPAPPPAPSPPAPALALRASPELQRAQQSGPSPWARGESPAVSPPPVAPVTPAPASPAAAPQGWAPATPPAPAAAAPPAAAAHEPLLPKDSPLMSTGPAQPRGAGGHVLPFRAGEAAEAPPPVAVELEPNPALGATVAKGASKGPTLPFAAVRDQRPGAAKASEPPPGMTLRHYAELCVERSLWPDNTAGRRARFGLDEAAEKQADAYFKRRFELDPAQRQTWIALCEVHKKKLDHR